MDAFFSSEILETISVADEEEAVDAILAAASDSFENSYRSALPTTESETPHTSVLELAPPTSVTLALDKPAPPSSIANVPARFPLPKSDEEVLIAREAGIPEKTQKDTKYCVSVYEEWRKNREKHYNTTIGPLHTMTATNMTHYLSRFVLEARKKNGTEYPANTLYHIIVGIMRHLRCNNVHVDFFRDNEFVELRSTLDSEMKRIQGSGIRSQPKQAEIMTEEEEELLWKKGLLGDSTPQSLLDTMVYCCGLFFALRSGNEHRRLRHTPCQIQVV